MSLSRVVPLFLLAACLAQANSSGPPIRRSGVPADDSGATCVLCHRSFPINPDTLGRVQATPASYTPGARQTVRVTLEHPEAARWGFQLTARLANDLSQMAGSFAASETVRVRCDTNPGTDGPCPDGVRQFASHTSLSTVAGQRERAMWDVEWTPPASDQGPVTFFVVGNATNNSLANTGDRVYSSQSTVSAFGGAATGQRPLVSEGGVVAGASLSARLRAVASGSWLAIFGANFVEPGRSLEWGGSFTNGRAPTSLDGVRVLVNDREAFVAFVRPDQVNVVAPELAGTGSATVRVVTRNGQSDLAPVTLQRVAPAFFTSVLNGRDLAATNLGRAARPGEEVALFASGLGQVTPAVAAGQVASSGALAARPAITVGGREAQVTYAGVAPGFAGLYQVNLVVPGDLPEGEHELVATVDGVATPRGVFLAVRP